MVNFQEHIGFSHLCVLGKPVITLGFQSESGRSRRLPGENGLHIDRKALNYNKNWMSSSPMDRAAPMVKE